MGNPVIDIECRTRGFKVTLIEDEKIFILVRESLDHMRLAFREIPDVAFIQDLVLVATELIDGTNSNLTCVHVAPFSLGGLALYDLTSKGYSPHDASAARECCLW